MQGSVQYSQSQNGYRNEDDKDKTQEVYLGERTEIKTICIIN